MSACLVCRASFAGRGTAVARATDDPCSPFPSDPRRSLGSVSTSGGLLEARGARLRPRGVALTADRGRERRHPIARRRVIAAEAAGVEVVVAQVLDEPARRVAGLAEIDHRGAVGLHLLAAAVAVGDRGDDDVLDRVAEHVRELHVAPAGGLAADDGQGLGHVALLDRLDAVIEGDVGDLVGEHPGELLLALGLGDRAGGDEDVAPGGRERIHRRRLEHDEAVALVGHLHRR